ncbi:hypothetical protein BC834DRAFT_973646 [Gloeopeniophorella convolvens]|nr:hypothetical protein BC834DRAFT_973646 [Gloeopeniophorella convolvens]
MPNLERLTLINSSQLFSKCTLRLPRLQQLRLTVPVGHDPTDLIGAMSFPRGSTGFVLECAARKEGGSYGGWSWYLDEAATCLSFFHHHVKDLLPRGKGFPAVHITQSITSDPDSIFMAISASHDSFDNGPASSSGVVIHAKPEGQSDRYNRASLIISALSALEDVEVLFVDHDDICSFKEWSALFVGADNLTRATLRRRV